MWLCASGPACQTCKRRCNASRMLLLLSWSSMVVGRAWRIYHDVPLTNNQFLDIPSTKKPSNCLGRNSKVMSVCLPTHSILQGGLQTKAQHNKLQPGPNPPQSPPCTRCAGGSRCMAPASVPAPPRLAAGSWANVPRRGRSGWRRRLNDGIFGGDGGKGALSGWSCVNMFQQYKRKVKHRQTELTGDLGKIHSVFYTNENVVLSENESGTLRCSIKLCLR